MVEAGHEILSHHYRWLDYQHVPIAVERKHVRLAVETLTEIAGVRPVGWMSGRPSPNTRRLIVEEGGFLYDRDALNDDLPYWVEVAGRQHLVIPYSYETNDNRFDGNIAFATAADFFTYMKDSFDMLYREGEHEPRMMSLALHDRLIGRPGRAEGWRDFWTTCSGTTASGSAAASTSRATGLLTIPRRRRVEQAHLHPLPDLPAVCV
jgi:peptidoglycan/xylan/chitin deacetylase (PgdA/CDA1 family)